MGPTKDQRSFAWNVKFLYHNRAMAGIYQRDNLVTVADVARDLDLCLVFPRPTGDGEWQAALIPMETETMGEGLASKMILLNKQDTTPFPTPTTEHAVRYTYVFHSCRCDTPGEAHGLRDLCIARPGQPQRRFNRSYLSINQSCPPRLANRAPAPKRRRSLLSSSASSSRHRSTSDNDTRSLADPVDAPGIIDNAEAQSIQNAFRSNVLAVSQKCAISGKGTPWLPGVVGTGVEAAHIVPSGHWPVYPLSEEQTLARETDDAELATAWRSTWARTNGIPMLSQMHQCFDARLVTIHPQTHRIRAFAPYDVLTEFHNKEAHLPDDTDANALQHHWNMCCIENMVAAWVNTELPPPPSTSLTPLIQSPVLAPHTPPVDAQREEAGHRSIASQHASHEPSSDYRASGGQVLRHEIHPPLPSSNKTTPERQRPCREQHRRGRRARKVWWYGDHFIGEGEARNLILSGYENVKELDEVYSAVVPVVDQGSSSDNSDSENGSLSGQASQRRASTNPRGWWWYGDHFIEEGEARDLILAGYENVQEVKDRFHGLFGVSTQETVRGRSAKRKRIVATDDHDGEGGGKRRRGVLDV